MAISSENLTAVLSGITASDIVFYAIGGGILVVMAGIWGFTRVRSVVETDDNDLGGYSSGRNRGDRFDAHCRYVDKYGLDAYLAREARKGR